MSSGDNGLYEFGPYLLDAGERVLVRGGKLVPLTPKAFETLFVLVRNSGRVMNKEDLLREIWPDTFVEEATLAQNIFTLRRALANGEDGPTYIETVPRRGYRFVAEVRERPAADAKKQKDELEAATAAAAAPAAEPDDEEAASQEAPREVARADAHAGVGVEAGNVVGDARAVAVGGGSRGDGLRQSSPEVVGHVAADEARRGNPRLGAVVIASLVLLGAAALVFAIYKLTVQRETRARVASPFQQMRVTRVAVNGRVEEAAVSPDGKHLAYVSSEAGRRSVWVRQVAAASDAKQVVAAEDGRDLGGITFSRDGEYVYFLTIEPSDGPRHATLRRVPALGGASQEIIKRLNSPAAFSPDGAQVAFVRAEFDGQRPQLALTIALADGTQERVLARRTVPEIFGPPAWSPDGSVVACSVRTFEPGPGLASLVAVSVADGAERLITPRKWYDVGSLAWLPDGRGLVVAASDEELSPFQLQEVSYPEGETRRITNDLNGYQGVSLTADASALVTLQTDLTTHLWVGPAADPERAAQVTEGAGRYDGFYGLSWTPDGRIVYASIASGSWDIWVMNADGSGQKQLTVGARSNYGPSVSPDGRYIVFVSNRAGGAFNVWRMDMDGSNPLRLTQGEGENFAHVTPDGRWVVYATVGFAKPSHVWKVPIDGGEPVRLVEGYASWPFVSPDGKFVAATFQPTPGAPVKLALFPFGGGPPAKLFDLPPTFRANTVWTPDGRAVTYVDGRDGVNNVWSQPVAGGPARRVTDFKSVGVTAYDWSPDGKRLAAARSTQSTSVVLMRDFR